MFSWYNQILYLLGGLPVNWKIIILQKFSHRGKSLQHHVRFPSLGIRHQGDEPPEHLTLQATTVWVQEELDRTGENRDSSLGGSTHGFMCFKIEGKAMTPEEPEPELVGLRGSPRGWLWPIAGARTLVSLENIPWCELSWRLPFWHPSNSLQVPMLKSLRPNNQQVGNTVPPINKKAA